MGGAAWVWIVLIIVSGIVCVSAVVGGSLQKPRAVPPEQLLKTRFASGEIGEEEYVRRLAVLQHDRLQELGD